MVPTVTLTALLEVQQLVDGEADPVDVAVAAARALSVSRFVVLRRLLVGIERRPGLHFCDGARSEGFRREDLPHAAQARHQPEHISGIGEVVR